MSPKNSPNWGGRRDGAGRPKEENAKRALISVRVPEDVAARFKELGGSDFLRPHILEIIRNTSSATNDVSDPLDPRSFRLPSSEPEPRIARVDMTVACGFASPAMDYATDQLSLSELMIRNELSTFFAEAAGDSMVDAGICEGDTLILDRSLEARSGDIVLAFLHGDFTLKRLRIRDGKVELCPENAAANYPVISPGEGDNFSIEGVLIGICRKFRR